MNRSVANVWGQNRLRSMTSQFGQVWLWDLWDLPAYPSWCRLLSSASPRGGMAWNERWTRPRCHVRIGPLLRALVVHSLERPDNKQRGRGELKPQLKSPAKTLMHVSLGASGVHHPAGLHCHTGYKKLQLTFITQLFARMQPCPQTEN